MAFVFAPTLATLKDEEKLAEMQAERGLTSSEAPEARMSVDSSRASSNTVEVLFGSYPRPSRDGGSHPTRAAKPGRIYGPFEMDVGNKTNNSCKGTVTSESSVNDPKEKPPSQEPGSVEVIEASPFRRVLQSIFGGCLSIH